MTTEIKTPSIAPPNAVLPPETPNVDPTDAPKQVERIPCNWNIVDEGGIIKATNSQTGRVFTGELSAFVAKFLR